MATLSPSLQPPPPVRLSIEPEKRRSFGTPMQVNETTIEPGNVFLKKIDFLGGSFDIMNPTDYQQTQD